MESIFGGFELLKIVIFAILDGLNFHFVQFLQFFTAEIYQNQNSKLVKLSKKAYFETEFNLTYNVGRNLSIYYAYCCVKARGQGLRSQINDLTRILIVKTFLTKNFQHFRPFTKFSYFLPFHQILMLSFPSVSRNFFHKRF